MAQEAERREVETAKAARVVTAAVRIAWHRDRDREALDSVYSEACEREAWGLGYAVRWNESGSVEDGSYRVTCEPVDY